MVEENQHKLATHIVALNYFSLIFIIIGGTFAYYLGDGALMQTAYFLLWIYLVPPVLTRIIIIAFGKPTGIVNITSNTHTLWWVLFQLQLIFNRFHFLEEALRVVPGIYALWLNLWGAKVNMFSFWGPGVTVMDRYHLVIGKGVILGTGCLLSAHVLIKKPDGELFLIIDKLTIDADALIGVRSTLSPGCHIHSSQSVAAQNVLKPYTEIKEGKKSYLKIIGYK